MFAFYKNNATMNTFAENCSNYGISAFQLPTQRNIKLLQDKHYTAPEIQATLGRVAHIYLKMLNYESGGLLYEMYELVDASSFLPQAYIDTEKWCFKWQIRTMQDYDDMLMTETLVNPELFVALKRNYSDYRTKIACLSYVFLCVYEEYHQLTAAAAHSIDQAETIAALLASKNETFFERANHYANDYEKTGIIPVHSKWQAIAENSALWLCEVDTVHYQKPWDASNNNSLNAIEKYFFFQPYTPGTGKHELLTAACFIQNEVIRQAKHFIQSTHFDISSARNKKYVGVSLLKGKLVPISLVGGNHLAVIARIVNIYRLTQTLNSLKYINIYATAGMSDAAQKLYHDLENYINALEKNYFSQPLKQIHTRRNALIEQIFTNDFDDVYLNFGNIKREILAIQNDADQQIFIDKFCLHIEYALYRVNQLGDGKIADLAQLKISKLLLGNQNDRNKIDLFDPSQTLINTIEMSLFITLAERCRQVPNRQLMLVHFYVAAGNLLLRLRAPGKLIQDQTDYNALIKSILPNTTSAPSPQEELLASLQTAHTALTDQNTKLIAKLSNPCEKAKPSSTPQSIINYVVDSKATINHMRRDIADYSCHDQSNQTVSPATTAKPARGGHLIKTINSKPLQTTKKPRNKLAALIGTTTPVAATKKMPATGYSQSLTEPPSKPAEIAAPVIDPVITAISQLKASQYHIDGQVSALRMQLSDLDDHFQTLERQLQATLRYDKNRELNLRPFKKRLEHLDDKIQHLKTSVISLTSTLDDMKIADAKHLDSNKLTLAHFASQQPVLKTQLDTTLNETSKISLELDHIIPKTTLNKAAEDFQHAQLKKRRDAAARELAAERMTTKDKLPKKERVSQPSQQPVKLIKKPTRKPVEPQKLASSSTKRMTPKRLLHLNAAVRNLIFIRKITTSYHDILGSAVSHYALLYNIARCFVSLKMYTHTGGSQHHLDANDITDIRNMILHHGASHVDGTEVEQFATALQAKLPTQLMKLTQHSLSDYEVEDDLRFELMGEFGLLESSTRCNRFVDQSRLVLDDTELYKKLVALHTGKVGKEDDKSLSTLVLEKIIPQMRDILVTVMKATSHEFESCQHYFVDEYFFHVQALRMLAAICGEFYNYLKTLAPRDAAFMTFIKKCEEIRHSIAHGSKTNRTNDYYDAKRCVIDLDNMLNHVNEKMLLTSMTKPMVLCHSASIFRPAACLTPQIDNDTGMKAEGKFFSSHSHTH